MANPLDDVTQDRRDDSGNPLRRVYIDTSDAPVPQGTGAGNALVQATQAAQPTPEAVPWTIEDLQRGVEAIKQYVAGNVAPVNDMAKRFANYDRQFTQDVINAPATIWNNPGRANEVGQRFLGGENWLSNMVRSATTSPGRALASETPVTSEQMIAPAQDIAGMATGSMLFGKPGAATLGSGPVRPGVKSVPAEISTPAPVFYSALEHAATNAAQETMSPQQWLGFLKNTPGVKAEELAWTGLPEWLGAQKGKVSKKDVQSYLDEHKVEIKDVTKTGPKAYEDLTPAELERVKDDYRETNGMEHDEPVIWDDVRDHYDEMLEEGGSSGDVATKYSSYQLPGGENYREHLLTMPEKIQQAEIVPNAGHFLIKVNGKDSGLGGFMTREGAEEAIADLKTGKEGVGYRSSHWDEPNVLAHVRTNDRTMARELSPEHVAVNEARAKVQQQIEANQIEQQGLARSIGQAVEPLERARQGQIRADVKAGKMSAGDARRAMEEVVDYAPQLPKVKSLRDKLEQLRAKETELGYSIYDIVPKTMTEEQALAAAKDWVNEGNPNSKKWEQTPKVRQDAWLEQVQKVAGRKAMNEAEKPVKSLHIEEIQSDWHQQGRKQGYKNDAAGKAYDEYMADLRERIKNDTLTIAKQHGIADERAQVLASESLRKMQPHEMARFFGEEPQMKALWDAKIAGDKGVPDAPFKTSWPELALKRMIRKAAEEGYDRISWTPGEAQAARYDLSKHLNKVQYHADKQRLVGIGKDGGVVMDKEGVAPNQVADYIGKDAAQKLLDSEPAHIGKIHELRDVDLKVGGEGMREFYDKMLPKMVEKIGKSHGVKVKTTILPELIKFGDKIGEAPIEQPVHYFDLPQSLKEHAIGRGFPLYMSGVPFPLTPVDYNPFEKKK